MEDIGWLMLLRNQRPMNRLSFATTTPRETGAGHWGAEDAAERWRLQVDPVVADFLRVATQATGFVHLCEKLVAQGKDRIAGGVLGAIPRAVVIAVAVHPRQQQVNFAARHLGEASLVAGQKQFGQRSGTGTVRARRQNL